MHKGSPLAVASIALLAVAMPLAAAAARPSPSARLDRALVAQLDEAPDRLAVLVHGASRQAALDGIEAAGLETLLVLESIGVPAAVGTPAAIDDLADEPGITFVEAVRPLEVHTDTAVVATRVAEAKAPTSPVLKPDGTPYTGAGHTIAVVDSGIDGTHPMFTRADGTSKVVRNVKVACERGVVWIDDLPEEGQQTPPHGCRPTGDPDALVIDMTDAGNDTDTISLGGHGTHVASIAAGLPQSTQAGAKVTGTAPGADLVGVSVGMSASTLHAAIGLDWILRHHDDPCGDGSCAPITVVNNSYGVVGGGEFDPEAATVQLGRALVAEGVVMVWSAGNSGGDGGENAVNPDAQDGVPGIIGVANYDDEDSGGRDLGLDPTSSRGDADDPSTWPDLSAPGAGIKAACRYTLTVCRLHGDVEEPDYAELSGTSMAAPHVAGIVTLLQEAKPGITPAQVELALENTAYRFGFGAPYEADPRNPASPSSFDKGHGLVDAVAALQAVLTGTESPGVPVCTGLSGTDPTGEDQPYGVNVVTGPYDPSVDLTGVSLTGDPAAMTATLRLSVADLKDSPPAGGDGSYFEATFSAGAEHSIAVQRAGSELSVEVDDTALPAGAAVGDTSAETITVTIPRTAFEPDLEGVVPISSVTTRAGRTVGVLVAWSDEATTGCGSIDVGGASTPAPGPAPKLPRVTPGRAFRWQGEATTSVDDPTGLDLFDVTPAGEHEDERRIEVKAAGGKSTLVVRVVADDPASNDFDLTVRGPDGSPVGYGADDPTSNDGTSASSSGDETVTVPDAVSGVYTVTVEAYLTVESTYAGTARLT